VAAVTEATIRELASIRGRKAPITSCYLDVDGRRLVRQRDLEHEVEVLLKGTRARADRSSSVTSDLGRIQRYVSDELDRSRVRGVAIFACAADDLWRVVELPIPVRTRVVVNHAPAVGQLESVLREHEPIGVLMADRQRARMFVFELGELVERSELFEELPRETDVRGLRDRGGDHPEALTAHTRQHLRNAAQVAFAVWSQHPFRHLAIAAPDDLASQLEADLHPYLRERLCGRLSVPVTANHGEVLAAAQQVESRVEREREAAVVDRLRAAVSGGRKGVAGLADTVEALGDRRVDTLLVSQGYSAPGWRCEGCDRLAALGRRCRHCGGDMVEIDDLVEDAIEEALAQSCHVEICVGNADLDVLGRAGALLRY
jgi:peptide chain release factor subunit 1